MAQFKDIGLDDVYKAKERIAPFVCKTPLIDSRLLSQKWNRTIKLKLENLQPTGAFKLRGAANAMLSLSEEERQRGVVTMSTGNHGRAIAHMAQKLNMRAVICISSLVPDVKIDAMKALGAEVAVVGDDQEEATHNALKMEQTEGLKYISAFDDPTVIAGQATTTLEILEQYPEVDTLLVPVSGGGLMSGMAFTAKALKPEIKMIGVTNDTEPAIYTSVKAGKIVMVGESESLADALPGSISLDNQYTFEMCKKYTDRLLLISEEQIAQAMAYALLKEKLVLEGGGAATLALLLNDSIEGFGDNIAAVCSGNSVNMDVLLHIANQYKASL